MVRRVVAGVGRTLITTGVLLLLFVSYQLWGTGIATAREQDRLGTAFEEQLAADGMVLPDLPAELTDPNGTAGTTTSSPAATSTTVVMTPTSVAEAGGPTTTELSGEQLPGEELPDEELPGDDPRIDGTTTVASAPTTTRELTSRAKTRAVPLRAGEAIGQIRIPRISVTKFLVEGTTVEALKKGPGHYVGTPLPGEPGNAAIAGHRTTYGAPFFRLDELKVGDPIFVYSLRSQQWFRYDVVNARVVKPSQSDVLQPIPGRNTLTLTTCHPRYSAQQRLIITAELVGEAVEADVETAAPDPFAPTTTLTPPSTTSTVAPPATSIDPTATVPVETTVPPTTVAATTVPDTTLAALTEDEDTSELTLDSRRSDGAQIGFSWLRGPSQVWLHTGAWALVCGAIWLAAWLLVHRRRKLVVRWASYSITFVVLFLPALYLCYENLARLLPENV